MEEVTLYHGKVLYSKHVVLVKITNLMFPKTIYLYIFDLKVMHLHLMYKDNICLMFFVMNSKK